MEMKTCKILLFFFKISWTHAWKIIFFSWFREFAPPIEKNTYFSRKLARSWHMLWSGHDNGIKWKHFPRYWPFVRGIHHCTACLPGKGRRAVIWKHAQCRRTKFTYHYHKCPHHTSHTMKKYLTSYRWLLVQDCSNSSANALELLRSCTKPSISWL